MPRLPELSRVHALVLFLVMALCAAIVAWLSFGLFSQAMANADFILKHGFMALVEGGAVQALLLASRGLVLLVALFCFKAVESELIDRWRRPRS